MFITAYGSGLFGTDSGALSAHKAVIQYDFGLLILQLNVMCRACLHTYPTANAFVCIYSYLMFFHG